MSLPPHAPLRGRPRQLARELPFITLNSKALHVPCDSISFGPCKT